MTDSVQSLAQRIDAGVAKVLVGAERSAFALELALFGRGHVLIEGVPGTGKTLLVRTMALLLGLDFRRIQFTPDLMPADVTGTTVFNPKTAEFSLRPGPLVANIVLADEINRTPPKTQSALLEAMEEGRVTIDGTPIELPKPFLICATQNPIEYEGTYPLPEAQVDRFMVKVESAYPTREQELDLIARVADGFDAQALESGGIVPVTTAAEILQAQRAARRVHVSAVVQTYIYDLIAATRNSGQLSLGASPRAAITLVVAAQVAAAIDGREYATPDDVKDVSQLVLAHRFILHPHAEVEGRTSSDILQSILLSTPVPKDTAAVS
ncbi:MAG: hypothetical protein DLM50_00565 [Candidatus Meridianibacter frigidus]|nr:MAG: hypothetical protein DLM50_00565 [Candidatus Eremiobacteraeota bacterium]